MKKKFLLFTFIIFFSQNLISKERGRFCKDLIESIISQIQDDATRELPQSDLIPKSIRKALTKSEYEFILTRLARKKRPLSSVLRSHTDSDLVYLPDSLSLEMEIKSFFHFLQLTYSQEKLTYELILREVNQLISQDLSAQAREFLKRTQLKLSSKNTTATKEEVLTYLGQSIGPKEKIILDLAQQDPQLEIKWVDQETLIRKIFLSTTLPSHSDKSDYSDFRLALLTGQLKRQVKGHLGAFYGPAFYDPESHQIFIPNFYSLQDYRTQIFSALIQYFHQNHSNFEALIQHFKTTLHRRWKKFLKRRNHNFPFLQYYDDHEKFHLLEKSYSIISEFFPDIPIHSIYKKFKVSVNNEQFPLVFADYLVIQREFDRMKRIILYQKSKKKLSQEEKKRVFQLILEHFQLFEKNFWMTCDHQCFDQNNLFQL